MDEGNTMTNKHDHALIYVREALDHNIRTTRAKADFIDFRNPLGELSEITHDMRKTALRLEKALAKLDALIGDVPDGFFKLNQSVEWGKSVINGSSKMPPPDNEWLLHNLVKTTEIIAAAVKERPSDA